MGRLFKRSLDSVYENRHRLTHVKTMKTTAQQRVKRKREKETTPNVAFNKFRTLRDRFYPLEEYDDEDFRLCFRLKKSLDIDLSTLCKEKSATYTVAASF